MLSRAVYKKQRGRRLLTALATLGLVGGTLLTASTVLAVHDLGVFELDKNATDVAATAGEDWDLICKAHPTTCTFAAGYAQPSGTTTADPSQFVVDPSESQQDDILKGGTKDDNEISSWKWASAKPSPPKNDIENAFAAEYLCDNDNVAPTDNCTGVNGDKLLYFGGDRFSNSGSANLAFWFFQRKVTQKLADGTTDAKPGEVCTSSAGCSFGGIHKAGEVPHNPDNVGDILIISAFGPKAQIQVYEWVGIGNAPSPCFTNSCSLVPLIPATAGQACEDVTLDSACGTVNDVVTPSPWTLTQKGGPANSFQPTNFFEGGLNLTNLGLAEACFSSFLLNTRASASGDAELHDKVIGQFGRCAPGLSTQASTNATDVLPGAAVTDRATIQVTGATSPDDAVGTATFYLCPAATPNCTTPQIGSPVTLTNAACDPVSPNSTDGKSCAVSLSVNDSAQTGARGSLGPGKYCFRVVAALTNYDSPDAFTNETTECFTVAQTPTSISTAQSWLPQDSATVTPSVAGTVVFSLYESNGTCSGTADRTWTVTDNTAPFEFATNNGTYYTTSKIISWSATFTPTDTTTYLSSTTTRCERSDLTIDNSASAFPPPAP